MSEDSPMPTSDDNDMPPHHHKRINDEEAFSHIRSDSALNAVTRILGMPVGTITALVILIGTAFGIWLVHDRAIALSIVQIQQLDHRVAVVETTIPQNQSRDTTINMDAQRITKLELREDDRRKQDLLIVDSLARIETKLERLENQTQHLTSRIAR